MIRFFDTCGLDYDSGTANQFWTVPAGVFVSADVFYGYIVNINAAVAYQAVPGAPIAAGICNVTMRWVSPGNGSLFQLDDYIQMDNIGRLTYKGHVSPPIPSPGAFHTYEFKTAAGAGTGTLELRLDGNPVPVWSLGGLNTGTYSAVGFNSNGQHSFDIASFVVQDLTGPAPANDYMGELKPFVCFPVADVGVPQFTNDFGGPNADQVNSRVPLGNAAFVHTSTPGDLDLYTIGAIPGDAVSVVCVAPGINALKYSGATRIMGAVLDNGTTQHIGADLAIASGQYLEYNEIYPENPLTGVPWALADFTGPAALRVGMTLKS